jgi:hypothetical protein
MSFRPNAESGPDVTSSVDIACRRAGVPSPEVATNPNGGEGAEVIPFPCPPASAPSWKAQTALATIDLVTAFRRLQRVSVGVLPTEARAPYELVCHGLCVALDAADLLGGIVWDEEVVEETYRS